MKFNTLILKTFVTALCILAFGPALLFAAETTRPAMDHGIIKSVDMETHTLVLNERKDNSEHSFQWNDQAKFMERGKPATAADLKEGEHVPLTSAPGGDKPILESMHISPARPEKNGPSKGCPGTCIDA